jgi:hypothetical protein
MDFLEVLPLKSNFKHILPNLLQHGTSARLHKDANSFQKCHSELYSWINLNVIYIDSA